MADFHPKSHPNPDSDLKQSLQALGQVLATSATSSDPILETALPLPTDSQWDAEFEDAVADIEAFFQAKCCRNS